MSTSEEALSRKLIEAVEKHAALDDKYAVVLEENQRLKEQLSKITSDREEWSEKLKRLNLLPQLQQQYEEALQRQREAEQAKERMASELEDLTGSVFEEANKMVSDARRECYNAQHRASQLERQLNDLDGLFNTSQKQLVELKYVLQSMSDAPSEDTTNTGDNEEEEDGGGGGDSGGAGDSGSVENDGTNESEQFEDAHDNEQLVSETVAAPADDDDSSDAAGARRRRSYGGTGGATNLSDVFVNVTPLKKPAAGTEPLSRVSSTSSIAHSHTSTHTPSASPSASLASLPPYQEFLHLYKFHSKVSRPAYVRRSVTTGSSGTAAAAAAAVAASSAARGTTTFSSTPSPTPNSTTSTPVNGKGIPRPFTPLQTHHNISSSAHGADGLSPSAAAVAASNAQTSRNLRDFLFFKRCLVEDIEPTLRLDAAPGLSWLARRSIMSAIIEASLIVNPLSPSHSQAHLPCTLCGDDRSVPPRSFEFRSRPEGTPYCACNYCVGRLRSVCGFVAFLHQILRGVWQSCSFEKTWNECIRAREAMFYARLGIPRRNTRER
ncbi:guanyl-nucleotide exchange factor Sec2 [Schizosaccharomyces japonicus yFS275]|uniref:Guanyl-nucleotide exchange factor Sec2 n=1 Tax=Schizosaccharomyces japonicus (strain yFS275 / FY16936) TaxID=402676 RepID=B6K2A0_SCHJY|nr:guanyl-nucleotide exchange factor Sec2 [Schizosaccharomyces japonicus yFS275]EEB07281.1 guanyl-nucleotide exchange factor Sec2 [Schizosaccharomyces japonicus yFS275]